MKGFIKSVQNYYQLPDNWLKSKKMMYVDIRTVIVHLMLKANYNIYTVSDLLKKERSTLYNNLDITLDQFHLVRYKEDIKTLLLRYLKNNKSKKEYEQVKDKLAEDNEALSNKETLKKELIKFSIQYVGINENENKGRLVKKILSEFNKQYKL